MTHIIETKGASVFTEKLKFEDSLTGIKTELTCDWQLNSGVLSPVGTPIADQLTILGFDQSVTSAYQRIYSNANMQSLAMMMFAGIM